MLIAVPVLVLFVVGGVIFLYGHAPRTWAEHWTTPRHVATGASGAEFGTAHSASGWDILWVDDNSGGIVLSRAGHPGRGLVLDRGDVSEPTLLRIKGGEIGAWVHDLNGSTALMGARILGGKPPEVFTIVRSAAPIEHPYLFGPYAGRVGLIFSWQERGNFENHLVWLGSSSGRPSRVMTLNHAEFYSFYPRAIVTRSREIGVLYLDECCKQQTWNILYRMYSPAGRPIGRPDLVGRLFGFAGQGRQIPDQWGEDLRTDAAGHVWGAVVQDSGVWVFEADAQGRILKRPVNVAPESGTPEAVDLVLTGDGGYVIWEQAYELGSYVDSQRFDGAIRPVGDPERVVYASGSQTNPHATVVGGKPAIVWQTISRGLGSSFDSVEYRSSGRPTIAEQLGLGLGDPWEELAVLLVGALGLATLVTTANILLVLVAGFVGWVTLRILGRVRSRWVIYAGMLTFVLYYFFVSPGGPMFFLDTIPSLGLSAMPYGFLACVLALVAVIWIGYTALRRIDDVYRAGMMAFLGVYFFAFLETVVFIQQRLGYV